MVHSRDDQEVGMAHEVKSSENHLKISLDFLKQRWGGIG